MNRDESKAPAPIDMASLVDEAMAYVGAAGIRTDRAGWLPTGLVDFDARCGGLAPGSLTLIGGRPGMGCEHLVRTIAANVARDDEPGSVLVHAPGEGPGRVTLDFLARVAKVDRSRLVSGQLNQREREDVEQAVARLSRPGRVLIAHAIADDLGRLEAQAGVAAADEAGLQLVVVESLESFAPFAPNLDTDQSEVDVGDVVRRLKRLAQALDVPVIATATLGRHIEERACKRPRLRDFSSAPSVEGYADTVATLFRPDYYMRHETPLEWRCKAELMTHRSRWGQPGGVILGHLQQYGLFVNLVAI